MNKVTCKTHGQRPGGIICRHLNGGVGLGFYRPDLNGIQDDDLQAWCHQCDVDLQKKGSWDEMGAENFALVCDRCFLLAESYNRLRKIDGHAVH